MNYQCPECGSNDVHGWREDIIESRYKLTKEGEFYSKPYKKFYNGADGHEGLICNKCGEIVNYINENYYKWEVKE